MVLGAILGFVVVVLLGAFLPEGVATAVMGGMGVATFAAIFYWSTGDRVDRRSSG